MTPPTTTRASLLLRLRDPDDYEAWAEFVSLYERVIYRVLRRTGLQDADARELLQAFFLAVNRNIERWQHGAEHGSFRGCGHPLFFRTALDSARSSIHTHSHWSQTKVSGLNGTFCL